MNKENRVIWQKLEKLGWCKEPTGIELDFFEDVIKCTKEAINYTRCCESDSELLCECVMPDPINPWDSVDKDTCRKCEHKIA